MFIDKHVPVKRASAEFSFDFLTISYLSKLFKKLQQ